MGRWGLVSFSTVAALLGLLMLAVVVVYVATRSVSEAIPAAPAQQVAGGDARMGPALFQKYGCGACHAVEGVRQGRGQVGPPLTGLARRAYLAGQLPNTPANLIAWIQFPQRIDPGNAMPDLNVTESDARDIAAYLYSLR